MQAIFLFLYSTRVYFPYCKASILLNKGEMNFNNMYSSTLVTECILFLLIVKS